jgi:hypothetical protein
MVRGGNAHDQFGGGAGNGNATRGPSQDNQTYQNNQRRQDSQGHQNKYEQPQQRVPQNYYYYSTTNRDTDIKDL